MVIRTNMSALRSLRERGKTTRAMAKNLEKLSSGLRINRASDDAAGLSISEKMRVNITELGRCQSNVEEGLDLARTADGALQELNDMLCRARELCIEAENGTYSDQERAAISDELNQLFGEIDRITASSKYNTIPLFRGDMSGHYRDIYNEIINGTGDSQYAQWGNMEFVLDKEFDPAEPAKPASATFQLNAKVDLNDARTLDGMSLKVGSKTYYFTTTPETTPHSSAYTDAINLNNYSTVQDVFDAVTKSAATDSYTHLSSISVKDDGTVTLEAKLTTLTTHVLADGKNITWNVANGNGSSYNGLLVQNVEGSQTLQQVDGSGAANNKPVYTSPCEVSFTLRSFPLTKDQADQINKSSDYYVVIYSRQGSSTISTKIELKDLGFKEGTTKDEAGAAIVKAINGKSDSSVKYTASYKSDGTVSVNLERIPSDSSNPMHAYVDEHKPAGSTTTENGTIWTSSALNITTKRIPGGRETGEELEITVPSVPSAPFSFRLGSTYYLYYDSTDPGQALSSTEYPNTAYSTSTPVLVDVSKLGNVQKDVTDRVYKYAQGFEGSSAVDKVTSSGNTISIKANPSMTIGSVSAYGNSITVTPYKITSSTSTDYVLTDGYTHYFKQEVSTTFDLSGYSSVSDLVGKGFDFNDRRIEFTDGKGLLSSYLDVDISGCTDFSEVAAAAQKVLGTAYTVSLSDNKMTISLERSTSSTTHVIVTDGVEGIMEGTPIDINLSGGTDIGYSETVLDFSHINESNLDTLLGKGFRINCATCEGEYINVFFCWKNDGSMPTEFHRLDESSGEMRTIHNIPVELSKVTSGDKIVESIVSQVRPSLTHYTDVRIGDPPTTLIALEKRVGGFLENGKLLPGKVQTGMETNFTYTVEKVRVPDMPEDGSVKLFTTDVLIYAGSEPGPQYIPIHLPHIDLEWLRLNPPEVVDLNADDQDAADWLVRVDRANIAISDSRGTIGADYNRLEHAFEALAVSEEQLTDAESRIRDADMAELMIENVKLQIRTQSQQSMLAQANAQPQQVLQLLT